MERHPNLFEVRLTHGDYEANVVALGATLRSLTHAGRDLILPFDAGELRPAHQGAVLTPWPGRIGDGRYRFGEQDFQLPINEVGRGNASHGLVDWMGFAVAEQTESAVSLTATVPARPGYPWTLDVVVSYVLSDDGLTWTVAVTNMAGDAAPVGAGIHPYFVAPDGTPGDWTLTVPARTRLLVDDRLLPTGTDDDVTGTPFDLRAGAVPGAVRLDDTFTELEPDADGRVTATLTAPGGAGVAMSWISAECAWVQVYATDDAVAIEPMTIAPDAFRTGTGLRPLARDATASMAVTISAR